MRKILLLTSVLCALSVIGFDAPAQIAKLTPLTTFGTNGDGTLRPGDVDYLNNSGQLQRGLAWNPVTGHLILVCRTNPASPSIERVLVLDSATGASTGVTNMDLSSLTLRGNQGFLVNLVGVADDGAIYAFNLSNQQIPAEIELYRWDNEGAPQNLMWYAGPPFGSSIVTPEVNRRWGDTLAVRGAGVNTEVLVASRGTNLILLRPTDSSMSAFYDTTITTTLPPGALSYGLTFGSGNTFWGTAGAITGGPLYYMSYDPNLGTATVLQTWYPTNVSGLMSPITYFSPSNWLAGIDTRAGADFVRIYSVTNPAFAPVNQDRATWIGSNANNNTFSGSVVITTNNVLYALDADNGIMAFTLSSVASNTLPPSVTLPPASQTLLIGSNTTMNAAADGEPPLSYNWQYKSTTNSAVTVDLPGATGLSITVTNGQLTNSGSYTFIVSNAYGIATSSVATLSVISAPQAFYEPFDYPAGSLLANQTPAPGKTWNPVTGVGGAISNINLTYPGLPTSIGNALVWPFSGNVSERLPTGTNISGTLFFSFLLRVDVLSGALTSDTIAGFGEATNTGNTVFDPKINLATNDSPAGKYQLGVYKGGGITLGALATNIFNIGDTVFIVGNYNFIPDALNDTVNMWVNPDPSTFGDANPPPPSVGPIGGTSGTDMTQLSHFFFRSTQNGNRKVADELRVGYSWAEVTPQAPPTLTVTTSGTNAVLSWPSFYGSDYTLQSKSNIVSGTWASVTNAVSVSGGNNNVTVPASGTRYFRLLK